MTRYETACEEYCWDPPDTYNFVRNVIDKWATDPAKVAIVHLDDAGNEQRVTFAEIAATSQRLCNALTDAGVRRGDTVIVMLGRKLAWWDTLTACLRMGVVFSPGTTQLTSKDIVYRINASQATAFITDTDNASKLDDVVDQCDSLKARLVVGGNRDGWINYESAIENTEADFESIDTALNEDALCYFTSGTTGYPKMTIHSHAYTLAHEITGRYWLDLGPDDLMWNISDTGWAKAAYSSYFGPWHMGATLFVYDASVFDPVQTLELLAQHPITAMCGAPTVYRMLVLQDLSNYQLPSLRHCVGAGEPLNPEVIQTWQKATGVIIRDGYGQTETILLCGNFLCLKPRFGSMGRPSPGVQIAIIDENGDAVSPNTEGDIAVRVHPNSAPGLFTEYRGDAERYQACFRGDWYVTGDRGQMDEDGYFWFVSRADDVILSAGYRIGPFEVESALLEHSAVAESAVVASPDETRGAVVKAFVVLTPGTEPREELVRELQEHVRSVTAPFKYPRRIEFVDSLPKTVSGKIRRIELRDREVARTRRT